MQNTKMLLKQFSNKIFSVNHVTFWKKFFYLKSRKRSEDRRNWNAIRWQVAGTSFNSRGVLILSWKPANWVERHHGTASAGRNRGPDRRTPWNPYTHIEAPAGKHGDGKPQIYFEFFFILPNALEDTPRGFTKIMMTWKQL